MTKEELHFSSLFKEHYRSLCTSAQNIVRDAEEAEDIVQDAFAKLWQRTERNEAIADHGAYLYRTVVNGSIDVLRHNRKLVPFGRAETNEVRSGDSAEQELLKKELTDHIEKALQKLPPRCRAVFLLSRYEKMKYKQIAGYLGISEKTVENQVAIALEKLRLDLKPHFASPILFALSFFWSGMALIGCLFSDPILII
jgi:RNA polymerase sigma-70 factor (ECF subfamily)